MTTICSLAVIAAILLVVQFISFSAAGVPVCDQPLDPGTCIVHTGGQNRMPIPRYYYKKETGTCEQFFTDICGGNENNFATREDCETSCKPDILCDPPPFFPSNESISPFYQKWYYDEWLKSCMKFNQRKCRGFGKRFYTKEKCERTCRSDCDQLLNPDPYKAHIERYYYDKKTRTCKSFMYGNCGGNDNNFATKEKCEAQCKPVKRTSWMWDYFWMLSLDDEHMFS
ncbi:carboxypeptidase inhibitor SmCI-like isoform X2 [Lithobates pipiens]